MHLRSKHKTSNFEVTVFSHFLTLRLIGSRVVVGNPRFSYPIYLSRSFPIALVQYIIGVSDGRIELRNGAKEAPGMLENGHRVASGWPDRSFVSPDSPLL